MNITDMYQYFWRPILHSYARGETVLPPYLGLSQSGLLDLLRPLDNADPTLLSLLDNQHNQPIRQLRAQLRQLRQDEYVSLYTLLDLHADPTRPFAHEMTTIVTHACLGSQHLWRDLGMPERPRLSQLFAHYYPTLFEKNNQNMRWKRFLYKQLCETGGDYVCRSPSCDTCSSYAECFIVAEEITTGSCTG